MSALEQCDQRYINSLIRLDFIFKKGVQSFNLANNTK